MNKAILSTEDQKEVDTLLAQKEEAVEVVNVTPDHKLSTEVRPAGLASQKFIAIQGLTEVPVSIIAPPFVRLVQPTSQNVQMKGGQEAPMGSFLFNDTLTAYQSFDFVLLRSKPIQTSFLDQNGLPVTATKMSVLGYILDEDKLFVINLSKGSFNSIGQLMAQFMASNIHKSWQFMLTLSSIKIEKPNKKYWMAKFEIGEELQGQAFAKAEAKALEYGGALDNIEIVPDDE
jgi:hypothetical protein